MDGGDYNIPFAFLKKLGEKYLTILGWVFGDNLILWVVGWKKGAVLPQLELVQKSQKILECDLKRKRNNHLFTGNPLNTCDTFVKLYTAIFHQGLHCLLRKKLFRQKYNFLDTPRYVQWTIFSTCILYQTRRKNPLVYKMLKWLQFNTTNNAASLAMYL